MVLNYILVGCPCCKSFVVCLVFVMFRLPRVILTAWWSSLQPHSQVLSPTALTFHTFHRDWHERTLGTRLSFVVVVPPQRLQLVIPTKIAIIEEKASARWTIGGGKGFSLYGYLQKSFSSRVFYKIVNFSNEIIAY